MSPVLVVLHAHPDDEAIFTGGTIVRAIRAGWRVVLVVATAGARGTRHAGTVADLAELRRAEAMAAASTLGVHRVEFLGYGDSGFGSDRGDRTGTLEAAPPVQVATRVRRILSEERATALTSYDSRGIYGHVDHVKVHDVARRAVAGTPVELLECTLDRDALRLLRSQLVDRGLEPGRWPESLIDGLGVGGTPGSVAVDVTDDLDLKLLALSAHSSQMVEAASFMGLPAGAFHHLLDTEWFRVARPGDGRFLGMLRRSGIRLPAPA